MVAPHPISAAIANASSRFIVFPAYIGSILIPPLHNASACVLPDEFEAAEIPGTSHCRSPSPLRGVATNNKVTAHRRSAKPLNPHFPDELPQLGMQFAHTLENKGFDAFHAGLTGEPNG